LPRRELDTTELFVQSAYRRMLLIRKLEERTLELSAEGLIAGSIHPSLGQEAIPVGAVAGLQENDRVLATYRGHGWAIAAGCDPTAVLAEIAQREGGTNGGRAGSALLSDPAHGFLGENSIVGAGVPIADGVALAAKAQGTGRVVVTSIGDGAMNQGSVTEGLVFAAARNLPVIVIVENNGWAEMTKGDAINRLDGFVARGEALGIESHLVDGLDPFAVQRAVRDAAEKCRRGVGPVLLECMTVRLKGHYNRDIEHYRSVEDRSDAAAREPIHRLRESALDLGLSDENELDAIEREVQAQVDAATDAVRAMALPDVSTVFEHLYGPPIELSASTDESEQELTYQRAANLALRTELLERPEVLVYGEDVGHGGGIFGVTRGLQKEFGSERVFDTPIAEAAILGSAVGAAMEGMRPIVEIMWADFVFVAFDQIINQASNVRYINSGRLSAPLTIRMQQGVTAGSCAQHSQSIEAFFAHIPGIKVGLVSNPQDAYDMLRAAVADPDPTVVVEFRSLYQESAPVRIGGPVQRAEGARVRRAGGDATIVTWGAMVPKAIAAAEALADEGTNVGVVDLRWLRPLDDEAIERAVIDGGGRVIVAHEATSTGGFGAEVAARIAERHGALLKAPVRRIGTPDVRMPAAPNLQDALIPQSSTIAQAVRELIA